MKFATLALLGFAAAQEEDFETELVKSHYPAKAVNQWMHAQMDLAHIGMAAEANFKKEHPHFEQKMHKMMEKIGHRYGPELEAWEHSKAVQAVNAHSAAVFGGKSAEMNVVISDLMTLVGQFEHMTKTHKWGNKMNADGSFDEWIDNKAARHTFERCTNLLLTSENSSSHQWPRTKEDSKDSLWLTHMPKSSSTCSKMTSTSTHANNSSKESSNLSREP